MPVTVRVGAVHLGWDVVSVAAGGGGTPIRPVQVEGMWTPPAYLLADSSGRLHTAGVDRQRPDLGMAIADVRDILGHPQIVVAGATWPAELVFRARMYNPLASIGKHLRGKPDLVALPFPDGWPDEKVEVYAGLVEKLDVTVEPLPESVALSGYVRALGLVHAPDQARPHGIGATGVYSDGRTVLVVAVHGDDEQPTESVDVPVTVESMRDARSADNVVIEVMAAARAIGADTSTVLLSGNVCFNDALRLAFQNHLGHRLQVADHPMHALVLGAAHLLVTDTEAEEPEPAGRHAEAAPPRVDPTQFQNPGPQHRDPAGHYRAESAPQQAAPGQRQAGAAHRQAESAQRQAESSQRRTDVPQPHMDPSPPRTVPPVQYGPGYPTQGEEPTTRITRDEVARGLPPNLAELGSRFTRPPGQYPEEQGRPGGTPPGQLSGAHVYQAPQSEAADPARAGQWREPEDDDEERPRKGKLWNKMKDNLFGAHTVVGAVALAMVALPVGGERVELAAVETTLAASPRPAEPEVCPLMPYVTNEVRPGISSARGQSEEGQTAADSDCGQPGVDTLRFLLPGPRRAIDPGPPIDI
ncbi:hypothetical protein DFR70_103273 [Nocardia tenerifensis]|uniref:Uncharacterized protein n=1 Tax=Nocardia tenerifensis TaxID=228006 RepID=A0A318K395_9NOCA|nr:hypothetical protein [Nocardia tenerifensis]PXX66524.1 hypothetical protein DFR70_103273 [Nocardia tenerifensis]